MECQLAAEPRAGGRVDIHLPEQGIELAPVLELFFHHVPADVSEARGHLVPVFRPRLCRGQSTGDPGLAGSADP